MKTTAAELPFSFRHLSMAGGVRAAAQRNPDKIAYRHGAKERRYRELVERIDKVSVGLSRGLGLGPGDHGAIVSKNSIEYMEIIFGASQAGVALATVNPKLAPAEIVAICADAGARVLFVDAASAEALGSDAQQFGRVIVIEREFEAFLAQASAAADMAAVPEWATFTIPYTSGTTGQPKGVQVSHRSRILTLFAMSVEYGCYAPDDRFLAIAPMCHGAGMIFSLAPVFFGGYAEIMDSFDPEQVVRTLKSGDFTGFFGVPTHFHAMLSLEQRLLNEQHPERLGTIISNAAALPQAIKEKLVAYYGDTVLHETYGSTEGGIVTNLRPPDQLRKQSCVGQPIAATLVSVRDDNGNECGPDDVGELFSTSPYLFNGYWQRPEATEEAWHDGWVTVGDMVRRDDEGYLYIVDRKKDMVISGGMNVYPREVEEVLFTHPGIREAAVIGVPDEKWGERLKAYVVSGDGAAIDADEIIEFCAERIARMKTPREIEFIDAIPRNANGKVLKTELRKRSV